MSLHTLIAKQVKGGLISEELVDSPEKNAGTWNFAQCVAVSFIKIEGQPPSDGLNLMDAGAGASLHCSVVSKL